MNTIEPTTQTWANEPKPKKKKTWIWILVGVFALCLCLVAAGVGLYFLLDIRSVESSKDTTGGGDAPAPPTAAPLATMFPSPTIRFIPTPPSTLVIETYDPDTDVFALGLTELIPEWEGSETPGVLTWVGSVSSSQPVVINQGWCTTTPEILEQNFLHIQITFEADGELVDMASMYPYDATQEDRVCRGYLGTVRAWPLGTHVIITTMIFDAPLNDGVGDYPAGAYIDQYIIEVSP